MQPSEQLKHPEEWVGELLHGKWRIDELLGLGGVASVYAATDRLGQTVAVKLMHGIWIDEPSVRERFLREGYSANRVKHPAVNSALADGVTPGGTPFLVLELLEGRSLEAELLLRGKLESQRVLQIGDEILDALAAAHDINVLHRDLKPDNLFLLHDGSVRVLDFGIARMHDNQNQRLTIAGRAMGTPGFMAPEQARGEWENVGPPSDIWSVGATMFALLTGREVHQGRAQRELLVAAMTKPAPPICDVEPTVPREVATVIDKALASDPANRYQSARDMQRAIRSAMSCPSCEADDGPATLRPLTTDPQASRRAAGGWRHIWRPFIVAAACLASVAAAGSDVRDRMTPRQVLHGGGIAAVAPRFVVANEEPDELLQLDDDGDIADGDIADEGIADEGIADEGIADEGIADEGIIDLDEESPAD